MNSKNSPSGSGSNKRNVYIVLSSPSVSNTNLMDPVFNRNYLSIKSSSNSNLNLSASAPNLSKTAERSSSPTTGVLDNIKGVSNPKGSEKSSKDTPTALNSDCTVPKPKVQLGMDRYVTVLKRGRSPKSSKIAPVAKITRDEHIGRGNRFAALQDSSEEPITGTKTFKPPPIYLRQKNSNTLIKKLIAAIGENSFFVII